MSGHPALSHFPYLRWQYTMDPKYPINSAAISADGSRCVAATFQGAYGGSPPPPTDYYCVNCWDRDGKLLWSDKFQAFEGAFAVAISGDASTVAAGGWMKEGQGYARVYDAETGKQLVTYYFDHRVNGLALSNDGSVLAIAENDAYLAQQSGGVFPTTPSALGLPDGTIVEAISMPADGSVFVVGDHGGNVYLVENNDGSIGSSYSWAGGSDMGPVHSMAISSDGAWFVAVGDSTSVYLFNLDSIKQKQYATSLDLASSNRLRWVTISADGSFISTVGNVDESGVVFGIQNNAGALSTLWDQPAKTKQNPNCASTDAAGKYVAVATGYTPYEVQGQLLLLNGATGEVLWEYQTPMMAWPCFISADGSGILAGSDYGVAYYLTPEASE
jgi:outer membrane protein assembly factor BamB